MTRSSGSWSKVGAPMHYCPQHQRIFAAAGYAGAAAGWQPAGWEPLDPLLWFWATIMTRAFPTHVQLECVACDHCIAQETRRPQPPVGP